MAGALIAANQYSCGPCRRRDLAGLGLCAQCVL